MSDDDFKHARHDDPETSHEGATFERERDRAQVHAKLFEAGAQGLADFQLEQRLGGAMNGKWRKRRSDLTDDDIVVDSGRRLINPATGKPQIVWLLRQFAPTEIAPSAEILGMTRDQIVDELRSNKTGDQTRRQQLWRQLDKINRDQGELF